MSAEVGDGMRKGLADFDRARGIRENPKARAQLPSKGAEVVPRDGPDTPSGRGSRAARRAAAGRLLTKERGKQRKQRRPPLSPQQQASTCLKSANFFSGILSA